MNIVEFKSTVDHLLHIVLYLITTGIAVGGLITVVCFYMLNDRRATQQRPRKTASTPAPLTED
jgi:hypothetical protein